MAEILAAFGSFYGFWRSFIEPVAAAAGRFTTANVITVIRAFGAPFVIMLVFFGLSTAAFVLFLVSAIADSFDGAVAAERAKNGCRDDPKLGAFLDAFCDKMFFVILLGGVLPMGDYGSVPWFFRILIAIASMGLLLIEMVLAGVRMADYQYERRINGLNHQKRLLKATTAGKLKFLLENIGVGGLIFSQPNHHHWAFYVTTASFAVALPFALESLIQKLRARRVF